MAKANLVIVESPAKAKTIGKYLGPTYQVLASMGHVRDLPKSKMGVDLETGEFEPQYQPIKGKEETIAQLKDAADHSKKVYLATDPDREGEAISWHLKELLELPDDKTSRVTFNEITKKVVTESIAAPREIDQNLVDAQQARRVLDRIVGYELSPLLWKKIRRGLSAGRVQSVATRLVAEREEDESLPPVELTAEAVSGLATEAEVPDSVRAQIEKSYEQVFGDQPPQAHNVLDSRLVEEGTVKAHTAALEQKVAVLQQELAHQAANAADTDEDDVPWETGTVIDVRMPQERAVNVHTEVVEGQKCLVIPLTGDESARINGVEVE